MVNKNTTKKTRKARKNFPLIKLICTISFLVGVILFVINAVTDYKTYTDIEIVKADVINVSGTKNGMLDVKYQYNYGGEKYEENVRQSVDEIKAGDKKEIRIRKSIPEKIITTIISLLLFCFLHLWPVWGYHIHKILILKFNIENLPAGILPVFFSQKSFGRQKFQHTRNRAKHLRN